MPHPVLVTSPRYAERFQCIGGACEDTCCQGWTVNVDKDSFEKYQSLPAGEPKQRLDAHLKLREKSQGQTAAHFAFIQLLPDGACPCLTPDRLCIIQAEYGEAHLCTTCKLFPRARSTFNGVTEDALALSCPEAARLVLCDQHLLRAAEPAQPGAPGPAQAGRSPFHTHFLAMREAAIRLVRQRRLALWQRLFLLGIFARRLDAIARGQVPQPIPVFLRDFAQAADAPELRTAMQAIPADEAMQLEIVVRLVNLRSSPLKPGPRLVECLEHFAAGIGIHPGVSRLAQIQAYQQAFARYYQPFFRKHPHMLENYLCNEVFRGSFPFAISLFANHPRATPDFAKAYAMTILRFALIKGLLIGNAAFHREDFSPAHVVHVVQTAFKHFEHNPKFLVDAYDLLAKNGLLHPQGLAILLRN